MIVYFRISRQNEREEGSGSVGNFDLSNSPHFQFVAYKCANKSDIYMHTQTQSTTYADWKEKKMVKKKKNVFQKHS